MASSSAQKQVVAEKIQKGSAHTRCFNRGEKLRKDKMERDAAAKVDKEVGEKEANVRVQG